MAAYLMAFLIQVKQVHFFSQKNKPNRQQTPASPWCHVFPLRQLPVREYFQQRAKHSHHKRLQMGHKEKETGNK